MTKILVLLLTLTLPAFVTIAQAQTPQQKPGAQKPAISGGQKKTKPGKLPRMSELDYLESKLKRLLAKINPRISGRKALPYRIGQSRKALKLMEKGYWGSQVIFQEEAPDWYRYLFMGQAKTWGVYNHPIIVEEMLLKWIPKYKKYLKEKNIITGKLSTEQLSRQVWDWLIPRERTEIRRLEEELAQVLKSIRNIRDRLAIIKSVSKTKPNPETKPKKVCKSSDGLLGAMNCVTKEIDNAGG